MDLRKPDTRRLEGVPRSRAGGGGIQQAPPEVDLLRCLTGWQIPRHGHSGSLSGAAAASAAGQRAAGGYGHGGATRSRPGPAIPGPPHGAGG